MGFCKTQKCAYKEGRGDSCKVGSACEWFEEDPEKFSGISFKVSLKYGVQV